MDYEKKYKEALERAREWYNKTEPDSYTCIVESIFPELKESEDEKIRKELVNYFTEGREFLSLCSFGRDKILAWLEKQGNQTIFNIPSRETILAIWELGNDWKELTNGVISTENGTQLDYIQKHWSESEHYLREKRKHEHASNEQQGKSALEAIKEEKVDNANKVEPKFKVGNTIKYVGERKELAADKYTIKEICNDCYITTCGSKIPFRMQEYYVIVNDAKGLKKIENEHICELDNSYTCVKFPFKAKVKSSGTIVTIHNGQLSSDGKEWIKYQSGAEDGYKIYKPNNLELVCEIEQKHAWSEEDENNLTDTCIAIRKFYHRNNGAQDLIDWLQSLKERMKGEKNDTRRLFT